MLRYLIFVIFGILLFLLLNTVNAFSVGNQLQLDDPNETLTEYLNTITTPDMDYCSLTEGFEACKARMAATGGSCQINSIT